MSFNIKKNKLGGLEDHGLDELKRAKLADLITFPRGIAGTNCFNCRYVKDKNGDNGYCSHPMLRQYVSGRMCCNLWTESGMLRAWEKK